MSKLSHLKQFSIQINGRLVLSPNTHHLHPPPWQWNWKQIFVAQNSIYLFHCFVCWPFGETENINFDWSDTFDQYCHYNWWTQSSGPGHWAGRTATIAHSLQQILSTDTLIFIHWIYLQNGENEGKQIMCINRFCLMRTLSKCWKYKQIMSINVVLHGKWRFFLFLTIKYHIEMLYVVFETFDCPTCQGSSRQEARLLCTLGQTKTVH